MKNIIRYALISAMLGLSSYAAPFMAVGDGAELFVTGTLGVRSDDNILLGSGGPTSQVISDNILDYGLGLDLTFGKDAQLKGSLTLVDAIANYSAFGHNGKLNTNLASGDFVTQFDDGKMKLGFYAGYHELNQNTVDVRGLIRRDVFTAGANGEVEVSQITAVGARVDYARENYKRAGFSDSDSLTVPIDFYYKWTPKVDLSFGYRYRDYQVDLGQDSTDHFFNIGARGEFSPKFTGKFAVGYNLRKISGGNNKNDIGLESSFAYEISPKTSLQFGATNDFGTSPQGQQQKNLTLNGSATTKISEEWSINAGTSWREISYGSIQAVIVGTTVVSPHVASRTDDYWEFTVGTAYTISANIRLLGTYVYRKYNGELAGSDFTNNVFSVAANIRY